MHQTSFCWLLVALIAHCTNFTLALPTDELILNAPTRSLNTIGNDTPTRDLNYTRSFVRITRGTKDHGTFWIETLDRRYALQNLTDYTLDYNVTYCGLTQLLKPIYYYHEHDSHVQWTKINLIVESAWRKKFMKNSGPWGGVNFESPDEYWQLYWGAIRKQNLNPDRCYVPWCKKKSWWQRGLTCEIKKRVE